MSASTDRLICEKPAARAAVLDRVHELRADALAAVAVPDGDGELGRLVVDVAVAVVFGREEAAERCSDNFAVVLGDDCEIAAAAPALVVARELRMRDRELVGRDLPLGVPGDGFVERPLHVLEVGIRPGAELGHRKCSQLPSSYGSPVEQQLDSLAFLAAPDLHERAGVYDRRQQLVVLAEAEVVDRRAVRQRDAVEVDDDAAARALGDVGRVPRDPVGDVDQRVGVGREGPAFARGGSAAGRACRWRNAAPAAPSGPVTTSTSPGTAPARPGTRSERPRAVTDT